MRRFLRYLRIAFSATCLIACVLLIALWVRSYWWSDVITVSASTFDARADSASGGATIFLFVDSEREVATEWIRKTYRHNTSTRPPDATWKFEIYVTRNGLDASLPHLFYILLTGAIAAVPWIRRFSLRTLLIATTLVAVVLGKIVYAAR